jgi:hypothetical protein
MDTCRWRAVQRSATVSSNVEDMVSVTAFQSSRDCDSARAGTRVQEGISKLGVLQHFASEAHQALDHVEMNPARCLADYSTNCSLGRPRLRLPRFISNPMLVSRKEATSKAAR